MKFAPGIEVTPSQYNVSCNGKQLSSFVIFSAKSGLYFVVPDGIDGMFINNKTGEDEFVSIMNSGLPDTFHEDYGFNTHSEAVGALLNYHKLL